MTAQALSATYKVASLENDISIPPTTDMSGNNPYQTAKGAFSGNRYFSSVITGSKAYKPNQDDMGWVVSNVATEEFDACIRFLSNQVQDLPMPDTDFWSGVFEEEPRVAIYNPSKFDLLNAGLLNAGLLNAGLLNAGLYDGFLFDMPQGYYETSQDIRHKIISGIDRQLDIAEEDRPDIALSKPSHSGLFNFAKAYKITTVPFVVLQDNGNLSVSWDYETGDEFNLTFLRDGSLNFVAFLNRTKEKESIIHGNDSIDGVIKFIQYNEIVL